MTPSGVMFHTWGRTIVEKAHAKGQRPIDRALRYHRMRAGVHLTIESDGTIYQILDTDKRGAHCGVSREQRRRYLNGAWREDMARLHREQPRALWDARWPLHKSPQHIYPGKSPNDDYIGVEMEPLLDARPNGLWFSKAQHAAAREIWLELNGFYCFGFPTPAQIKGYRGFPQCLGHGDITPHSRWDRNGSWDPGAMRLEPRFDWSEVLR